MARNGSAYLKSWHSGGKSKVMLFFFFQGHPWLHRKFKGSLRYVKTIRPHLKKLRGKKDKDLERDSVEKAIMTATSKAPRGRELLTRNSELFHIRMRQGKVASP